jgi:hypothetical protein
VKQRYGKASGLASNRVSIPALFAPYFPRLLVLSQRDEPRVPKVAMGSDFLLTSYRS